MRGDGRQRIAATCGLLAAALALIVPIVAGRAAPGYSHRSQFISELGAQGAANGALVSLVGFAPVGVLVLVFVALARGVFPATRRAALGRLCLAMIGVAYLVSAVFRCDAGCPASGSFSQLMHNGFGVLEYIGAAIGFGLLAPAFRDSRWRALSPLCAICALIVAVALVVMLTPALAPIRGVSQRVAETAIFGWMAIVSATLFRLAGHPPA